MGAWCSKKNKPLINQNGRQTQNQQSNGTIEQKNINIEIDQNQYQPLNGPQIVQQLNDDGGQPVNPNQENKVQTQPKDEQLDEDLYINDIMKQFDELNQLFNQMAQEFDSISQYLLSVSGNQGELP